MQYSMTFSQACKVLIYKTECCLNILKISDFDIFLPTSFVFLTWTYSMTISLLFQILDIIPRQGTISQWILFLVI